MSTTGSAPTTQNLPFLPGYRVDVDKRERFHKTHRFDVNNGIRVDINRENPITAAAEFRESAGIHPMSISAQSKEFQESMDAKYATPEATMSRMPAWVAYDRKVLRFYGYFKEAVHASSSENWRVRKAVVYYYLEDDSMHIAEPKIENSGIPQGVFVKRHRIPKSDNSYFTVDDLYIGAELDIYGRVFRLIDCDAFTREFYISNGNELSPAERFPVDPFTKKHTYRPHTHHKLMNPLKEFMEASLGKPMGIGIENTQKFLTHDGKVLRFYARWDDDKMYGERRPYILHYFLADDTVEVQEIAAPNSGRDPFPSLLKRQKLPKDYSEYAPDLSRIGVDTDAKVRYYTDADFRVGGYVNVYGRQLFLCGADKFTQDYYIQNYGLSVNDFPRLQMNDESEKLSSMSPPPYTGFGSEEDSLGSFLYLMPKVPKQDFKKLMENDGINLRYMARFVNSAKVDRDRRFIVTYYLNNDTLSIFEKFERNSGFIGGKFLERARVKNPNSGEFYKATDLHVGAVLSINQYVFELMECDEYTKKFVENNQHIFKGQQASAYASAVANNNHNNTKIRPSSQESKEQTTQFS